MGYNCNKSSKIRSVKAIEKEVEELKSRLAVFKLAKTELVTKEEKKKVFLKMISDLIIKFIINLLQIQKEGEKYVKEWRKLKRISNEMMSIAM